MGRRMASSNKQPSPAGRIPTVGQKPIEVRLELAFLSTNHFPLDPVSLQVDLDQCLPAATRLALDRDFPDARHPAAATTRFAVVMQVVFLRSTGRPIFDLTHVPEDLVQSLSNTLGQAAPMPAALRQTYRNRGSVIHEHQRWARAHVGITDLDDPRRIELQQALRAAVEDIAQVQDLIRIATSWLFARRKTIPPESEVKRWCEQALLAAERQAMQCIEANVPLADRENCRQVLLAPRSGNITVLSWLSAESGSNPAATPGEVREKVEILRRLRVHTWNLEAISIGRQRHYGRLLDPESLRNKRRSKSTMCALTLACFLRTLLNDVGTA